MPVSGPPRILVCAHEINALAEIRRLLNGAGFDIVGHLLNSPEPDHLNEYLLLVIDATGSGDAALAFCRRLRQRLDEVVLPIIFITDSMAPAVRLASFEAGADTYLLRPFASAELLAQVRAFLRIKDTHDRLAERTAEINRINKRLQHAYQQIDQELQLAQRIQESFLPRTLPDVPRAKFAVKYLLCGRVGGDFYDIFRLDERHVGLYVADAMGHGVPASLLTIFVKKGIRAKEVFGNQYRLVPPADVLHHLNQELIDQKLTENPFITMIYGLLDHQTGQLELARAGHPYPLFVPREGALEYWQQPGLLLGVDRAAFAGKTYSIGPGDKVLLYSDGIDSTSLDGRTAGAASLLAAAEKHRQLPVDQFVERLSRDLFGAAEHPDDLTLLAIERTA
ncbi:MAG: PP2C family protein-serine/threonine phosphatase [Candidatus Acidiferrum sp.]